MASLQQRASVMVVRMDESMLMKTSSSGNEVLLTWVCLTLYLYIFQLLTLCYQ